MRRGLEACGVEMGALHGGRCSIFGARHGVRLFLLAEEGGNGRVREESRTALEKEGRGTISMQTLQARDGFLQPRTRSRERREQLHSGERDISQQASKVEV